MRLTIEQPALLALLTRVTGVVEKRNIIPILSNVLLSADGIGLHTRATDMDIDVMSSADAEVSEDGECTVQADMLKNIVARLSKGKPVNLSVVDDIMHITSGKSAFQLATLPVEDFPTMNKADFSAVFMLAGADLSRLFGLAAFAMSTEETRYYLNGIYLHPVDGKAVAVSTDGHRLARINSDVEADFPGVIVPRKTVAEVRKLVGNGQVEVHVSETKIMFEFGETTLISKVIDGTFPDYTRVIPKDNDKVVVIDAEEMKNASARVSLVSTERTRGVRVDITPGAVTLTTTGNDGDTGVDEIEAEYTGDLIRFAVNAKYLAEVLQNCAGDTMEFNIGKENDPLMIHPSEDQSALYIVMPIRY